jgi:hypothetical protein
MLGLGCGDQGCWGFPVDGVSKVMVSVSGAQTSYIANLTSLPIWRSKSSIARRGVSNFVQLSSVNRRKVIILWLGPRNTSTQERYVLNDQEGLMKKTKKSARQDRGVQPPSAAGPH